MEMQRQRRDECNTFAGMMDTLGVNHQMFSFLSTNDWMNLRLVDKATLAAVTTAPFDHIDTRVLQEDLWFACYPKAVAANFSFRTRPFDLSNPIIANLTTLNLCCSRFLTDSDCLNFSNIRKVNVSHTSITDDALSHLTRVEDLDVSHCPYVTGEAFVTLGFIGNLKKLVASSCPLLDGSYLAELSNLEDLNVGKCPGVLDVHLGDLRLHSLCVTDNEQIKVIPPGLKSVWMNNCGVTTLTVQNVDMLCVSPDIVTDAAISKLGGVKHFIIAGRDFLVRDIPYDEPICRMTNMGLKHLAGIKCLGMMKFPCPGVTDAGFAHLGSLIKLSIVRWSHITDAALEYLPNLQDLNISECDGIVGTVIPKLKNLQNLDVSYASSFDVDNLVLPSRMITLDVSGLDITDEHVARFPKGLSQLIMASCELVTEASIPHCLDLEFLEIVDCPNIKLTEAVKEQLRKIPDVYFGWVE